MVVNPLDRFLSRKEKEDKAKKEIKRRRNISKRTRGRKRQRKKENKYKKRRKKKVTTTQVAQPPIKLTSKEAKALLQVNITAKERRKKRKQPAKTYAEKRADEIAKTGVADASVLKHAQRTASEMLGYTTQARDPTTLRGGASRYNVAGGVGGFHDVSARYDTKNPQQGIRTPQNTKDEKREGVLNLPPTDSGKDGRRKPRGLSSRRGRGGGDDDDDDDDFHDAPRPPTVYPPYDWSYFHGDPDNVEEDFFDPAYQPPPRPAPYRPITAETRYKPPPPKPTSRTPTASTSGVITPQRPVRPDTDTEDFETDTDETDFEDEGDLQDQVPKPRRAEARPRFKPLVRRSIPPSRENFQTPEEEGSDITMDILEVGGLEPPSPRLRLTYQQPQPEPEPTQRLTFAGQKKPPRPESPIEDFEFVDVQEEEPQEPPPPPQDPRQDIIEKQKSKPLSTGRGRGGARQGAGRPKGGKNKPKPQPEPEPAPAQETGEALKEIQAKGRMLLKQLKNLIGSKSISVRDLDQVATLEEINELIETVYGDVDETTKALIRELWTVRAMLGKTPRR